MKSLLHWWTTFARNRGWVREPTGEERIVAHLEALRERKPEAGEDGKVHLAVGGQPNYCVALERGLSRVELLWRGRDTVRIHAYADALLLRDPSNRVRPASSADLDFSLDAKQGAFGAELSASALGEVARCAKGLLMAWLEQDDSDDFSVSIEPERGVDDDALIEHIKQLVKSRDLESRRQVYQAIVEAFFYVPVDLDGTYPQLVADGEELDGRNPIVAFSNRQDLSRHRAGRSAMLMSGVRLVQLASRAPARALQINPRSRYGGELYPHEVESIAEYLRRFGLFQAPDERPRTVH